MQDGGEKSYSAYLDPTTIGNAATIPHPFNVTPIVIMEPSKIQGNLDTATYSQHATTNATLTVGITKLITLPKTDSPNNLDMVATGDQAFCGLVPETSAVSDVRARIVDPYCAVFPTRHHRHHGDYCLRRTRGGRLAQSSVAGDPAHGNCVMFKSQRARYWIRLQQVRHLSGKSRATDKDVDPGNKRSRDRHAERYPCHH